jgi:hypothetical protein
MKKKRNRRANKVYNVDSGRKLRRRKDHNGGRTKKLVVRTDAGPSYFLTTELEALMSEVYMEELPPFKIFELIPVSTEIPAGAETIAYRMFTPTGMAVIIRQPSNEIPRVDLFSKKFQSPVYEMADSYGYTLAELESAQFAGLPLERDKATLAREVMARTASEIAINGGAAFGVPDLPGILTNTNIPRATVANPGGGTQWTTKTAPQIIVDLRDGVAAVITSTQGVEEPDTILVPIAQYELLAGLQNSTASDETVLSFFLKTNPHIKKIDWLRELDGAGTGGADIALVYDNNPSKLKYHMPLPFQQRPAQEANLEIVVNCRERTGGVIIPKPLSLRILEGI